jgi:hypothetical protein
VTRTRVIVGAALIGLVVLTVALLFEGVTAAGTAQIVGFQRTGDARKIVVVVGVGLLDELAEREVREDARSVTVKVHTRSSGGTAAAVLIFLPVTVSLHDALGTRDVLDGSGKTVRDLGTYELPGRPSPPP